MRKKDTTTFTTEKGRKAKIHPSSVNSKQGTYRIPCKQQMEVLAYQDLVSIVSASQAPGAATLLMLNTTPMSLFSLLLTCGSLSIDDGSESSDDAIVRSGEGSDTEMDSDGEEEGGDVEDVDSAGVATSSVASRAEESAGSAGSEAEIKNETLVVKADGWLRLKMSKETFQVLRATREKLTQAFQFFVEYPHVSLPTELAQCVDNIVQVMCAEQTQLNFGANGDRQLQCHSNKGK